MKRRTLGYCFPSHREINGLGSQRSNMNFPAPAAAVGEGDPEIFGLAVRPSAPRPISAQPPRPAPNSSDSLDPVNRSSYSPSTGLSITSSYFLEALPIPGPLRSRLDSPPPRRPSCYLRLAVGGGTPQRHATPFPSLRPMEISASAEPSFLKGQEGLVWGFLFFSFFFFTFTRNY